MEGTYTYTARSAKNPSHVATFTLHGDEMTMDMSAGLESVQKVVEEARADKSATEKAKAMVSELPRLQPAVARLAQTAYNVNDVMVSADDDSLAVTAWTRLAGLRAVPMVMIWEQVDNPAAAKSFEAEIKERKRQAPSPGFLPGPLDYWGTWLVMLLVGGFLFWRQMQESQSNIDYKDRYYSR